MQASMKKINKYNAKGAKGCNTSAAKPPTAHENANNLFLIVKFISLIIDFISV